MGRYEGTRSSRTAHKYILYVYSKKYKRFCTCREYNTLAKIYEFHDKAVKQMALPESERRMYIVRYLPADADLQCCYIRHIVVKVTKSTQIDEVLDFN